MESWNNRFLSQSGKELLLKAIALALPIYSMNCFKLPGVLCERLMAIYADFWWGSNRNNRSFHWCAWKRLCFPKKEGGMGFRELSTFNDALLGKQIWRILQNPLCLMSRVLKGRYFANSTIIEASSGSSPSVGWKSLLSGLNLVKKGLRFVVGNGQNIKTSKDPWIPSNPPRPPRLRDSRVVAADSVSDYIQENPVSWDEQKLRLTFHEEDVNTILLLKLPFKSCVDSLGWQFTLDGNYTVKSGYWVGSHVGDVYPHGLPLHGDVSFKSRIWKLNILPRIKMFLWRGLSNLVASRAELYRRRISQLRHCPRCDDGEETLDHILFQCSYARNVWLHSPIVVTNLLSEATNLSDRLGMLLDHYDANLTNPVQASLPFWIIWHVWKSRNQFVFQQESDTWRKTLRLAMEGSTDWLSHNSKARVSTTTATAVPNPSSSPCQWAPPVESWIKCNYDGSFCGITPSMAGWILRDQVGLCLGAGQAKGRCVNSPFQAELQALLFAMQSAWVHGYRRVIFEGDNQRLPKFLESTSSSLDDLNWKRDIQWWVEQFDAIQFRWTPRQANKVADALAKDMRVRRYEFHFSCSVPDCIASLLHEDSMYHSHPN